MKLTPYIISSIIAIAGCGGNVSEDIVDEIVTKEPGVYVGEESRTMESLRDEDVFLKINGRRFTKRMFRDNASFFDKISRLMSGDPLTGANPAAERTERIRRPGVVSDIYRRGLISTYADKIGVKPTEEQLAETRKNFSKQFKNMPIDEICSKIGEREARVLNSMVVVDATSFALRQRADTNNYLTVSEEHINTVSNRVAVHRASADASNAVSRAKLEMAKKELDGGADFAEVARKYSNTPDDGVEWGEYDLNNFETGSPIEMWLRRAEIGAISDIFLLDDGFAIVKVNDHTTEKVKDGFGQVQTIETWKLARISAIAYDKVDEMTRDEIIENTLQVRHKKLQKIVADEIMATAVIEWPVGTNLFNTVKSPENKPAKK